MIRVTVAVIEFLVIIPKVCSVIIIIRQIQKDRQQGIILVVELYLWAPRLPWMKNKSTKT